MEMLSWLAELALVNSKLSSCDDGELSIVLRELQSFKAAEERLPLLRYKASLDRGIRLAAKFTDTIQETFQSSVNKLGNALGLPHSSVHVFSESFVRSHIIFQTAKCLETISLLIKSKLGLPPFTVISIKPVSGKVIDVRNLYDATGPDRVIAFVDQADGTEEIPENVCGVILAH
jgi:hypothetical protein